MGEHMLPAVQGLYLAQLVKRWNVSTAELFAGTGVSEEALKDVNARVSIATAIEIIERARKLTGEPALGYYLGLQMRISMHGYVGFAVLSAPTLRAGIEIMNQFIPLTTTALSLRLRVHGNEASLILEEHADFGRARDAVLMTVLVGIWQMGKLGTGREFRKTIFDFAMPELGYCARLPPDRPRMRFGRPITRLKFDAAGLDVPYTMADPIALQLAKEQCEKALNRLGSSGRIAARVRHLLAAGKSGFPSLRQLALQLHISPRTLNRQLAAEGHTFEALLEEERRETAAVLLQAPGLSIDQVAARLGYSNAQNFARALRRWTGLTPAAFRDRALDSSLSRPRPR